MEAIAQLLALAVVVGADDRHRVSVIRHDDDQRIVAVVREILGYLDDVVEHDGVVDGTLPVERVADICRCGRPRPSDEALVAARENLQRRAHLVGQIRLVGELVDRALLEELAVERAVDILVVEEAEQLSCLGLAAAAA